MWGNYGMGWGWSGWGVFGAIHMVLWWVLLIVAIVVLVKMLIGGSSRREPPAVSRAFEILKERYARGEIEREEFEQKKRDLGH